MREYQGCTIPVKERWVHCGALFYDGEWRYLDADIYHGVTEVAWEDEAAKAPRLWRFEMFGYEFLDRDCLREKIGTSFSKRKLAAFKYGGMQGDEGVTCGELLALCDHGVLCRSLGVSAMYVRPVDVQMWGLHNRKVERFEPCLHSVR